MGWEDAPLHELSRFYASQLNRWVEFGRPPDALVTAILENDLRAALSANRPLAELHHLIAFVDRWVPGAARGNAETLERWEQHNGRSSHRSNVDWMRPENEKDDQ